MTIKEFAQDMFAAQETSETPSPMTVAEAAYNLACYKQDGIELPKRITAVSFANAWNSFLPKKDFDIVVTVTFKMSVPVEAASKDEARRIINASINGGNFFLEYDQELNDCFDATYGILSCESNVKIDSISEAW